MSTKKTTSVKAGITVTNLLQVQHSGLHPGHLHLLVHLVNVPFDQAHRQSLHHKQLNLQTDQYNHQPTRGSAVCDQH